MPVCMHIYLYVYIYIYIYIYAHDVVCVFGSSFLFLILTFLFILCVPTLPCHLSCYGNDIAYWVQFLVAHSSKTRIWEPLLISFSLDQFGFFVIWQHIPWVRNGKFTSSAAGEAHTSRIVGAYLGANLGTHRFLLPWCSRGFMGSPDFSRMVPRDACLLVVSYCFENISDCRISS